jgi:hypothetical protein
MCWRFSDLNRNSIPHLINCLVTSWWPGTEIGQHAVDWRDRQADREKFRQLSSATTLVEV